MCTNEKKKKHLKNLIIILLETQCMECFKIKFEVLVQLTHTKW